MMMMRKEDIFRLSRSPHVSWDGGEQVCLRKTEKGPSEKEGGGEAQTAGKYEERRERKRKLSRRTSTPPPSSFSEGIRRFFAFIPHLSRDPSMLAEAFGPPLPPPPSPLY